MALKVKIGSVIQFTSTFELVDGDKRASHRLELVATRKKASELRAMHDAGGDKQTYADLCRQVITGWKSQTLIVDDETEQPAPYSAEALDLLLDEPGVAVKVWADYADASGPQGKRGN